MKENNTIKEIHEAHEPNVSEQLKDLKDLKEKNTLKALRKRKLKEVRRKLNDISAIIESIAIEEEKQISHQSSELSSEDDKELQNIENLRAVVHGIEASILLIDSTLD